MSHRQVRGYSFISRTTSKLLSWIASHPGNQFTQRKLFYEGFNKMCVTCGHSANKTTDASKKIKKRGREARSCLRKLINKLFVSCYFKVLILVKLSGLNLIKAFLFFPLPWNFGASSFFFLFLLDSFQSISSIETILPNDVIRNIFP